uniref:3-dehydrosphinganine reductase n=1 Tax=Caligus clemensi TaxID=344056 RepID=C1C1M3_CALCM|nr:3-ketodihydrosphingosine reductase precursor [Caligus clemensi]
MGLCCLLTPALCLGLAGTTLLLWLMLGRKPRSCKSYPHVLITGGSSGIGKATAKEVIRRGASLVTLWARNKHKLEEARDEIISETGGKVNIFSVDVTDDLSVLMKTFEDTVKKGGDIRMVIHCAGTSFSGTLENTSIQEFERMMRINFLGTVNLAKTVVPHLKSNKSKSHLTFISSVAGVMGLYGFTAYSASKFALRGFAESLEMEVRPFGLSITLSLPPDTDTPAFAEENKSKPRETALISESGGLFEPEVVARGIVEDTLRGAFLSSIGFDGWLLRCICFGMSPTDLGTVIAQTFAVGPLRFITWCYTHYFANIVAKCHKEKQS